MGDCHLGGWRQSELKKLNFQCFQEALTRSLNQKVDFILISGDLFDSPYPPIETLKETFEEFRKLKEKDIPVFIIAGSHDYSVSGKTFLDVLEKAGFCKNVFIHEIKDGKIILNPTICKGAAIYGYPGRKSGLEVEEIEKVKLQDAPGLFKILMLHTAIRDAVGNAQIKSVDETTLPKVDYLALSHLHINYYKGNIVYSGPTFPNNISELEELQGGSFFIFDNGKIKKEVLKTKEIISVTLEINDALTATERILQFFEGKNIKDKIIIIRVIGHLEKGKISDINFQKIESFLKEKEALVVLKSTSKLHISQLEVQTDFSDSENLEAQIINKFREANPNKFNAIIGSLINSLKIEKNEDETVSSFEERLLSENRKIIEI